MRNYKKFLFMLIIIVIILILYKVNSFNIAILTKGFNPQNVKILKSGTKINKTNTKIDETEFKVALLKSNNNITLLMMEKNKLGFWKVMYSSNNLKLKDNYGKEIIKQPIEICWYTPDLKIEGDKSVPIIKSNCLYYGNNAIKPIEFLPNQISDKIDIQVEQNQNEYIIYATSEEPIKLDMRTILLQLKYIKD